MRIFAYFRRTDNAKVVRLPDDLMSLNFSRIELFLGFYGVLFNKSFSMVSPPED